MEKQLSVFRRENPVPFTGSDRLYLHIWPDPAEHRKDKVHFKCGGCAVTTLGPYTQQAVCWLLGQSSPPGAGFFPDPPPRQQPIARILSEVLLTLSCERGQAVNSALHAQVSGVLMGDPAE